MYRPAIHPSNRELRGKRFFRSDPERPRIQHYSEGGIEFHIVNYGGEIDQELLRVTMKLCRLAFDQFTRPTLSG